MERERKWKRKKNNKKTVEWKWGKLMHVHRDKKKIQFSSNIKC